MAIVWQRFRDRLSPSSKLFRVRNVGTCFNIELDWDLPAMALAEPLPVQSGTGGGGRGIAVAIPLSAPPSAAASPVAGTDGGVCIGTADEIAAKLADDEHPNASESGGAIASAGESSGAAALGSSVAARATIATPRKIRRAINFRRLQKTGRERLLIADPVRMTGKDWKMFVDRGHGFHATSMVTRIIAALGTYIGQIEDEYQIYSEADLESLKAKDLIAYEKYQMIRKAQDTLRGFYELERQIDPADIRQQEAFRSSLLQVLSRLRSLTTEIATRHWSGVGRADKAIFLAETLAEKFEWPLDPEVADGTRRKPISKLDQLLPEDNETVIYDPSLDISDAPGSSVLPTISGFSKLSRNRFAHCIMRMEGFPAEERVEFRDGVRALLTSEGILPHAPASLRRRERITIAKQATAATTKAAPSKPQVHRRLLASLGSFFTSRKTYTSKFEAPTIEIDTSFDPFLEAKAQELALLVDNLDLLTAEIRRDDQERLSDQPDTVKLNSMLSSLGITSNLYKKIQALALYYKLISLPEDKIQQIIRESWHLEKCSRVLAPYHDFESVIFERQKASTLNITFAERLKSALSSFISPGDTVDHLTDAQIKQAVIIALNGRLLIPESESGPTFLRASLAGSLYTISSSIAHVLESMGRRDPMAGTVALAAAGATGVFSAAVAAHGGVVATAKASSKLVAELSKTRVLPAIYQGVMPVGAHAGMMTTGFASLVDGVVLGKAVYAALSFTDYLNDNGGFTQELINALIANPLECAMIAGAFWGMGFGFITVTHAQAMLGNWQWFDELTGSIKPAAISIDMAISLYKTFKSQLASHHNPGISIKLDLFNQNIILFVTNTLLEAMNPDIKTHYADKIADIREVIKNIIDAIPDNEQLEGIGSFATRLRIGGFLLKLNDNTFTQELYDEIIRAITSAFTANSSLTEAVHQATQMTGQTLYRQQRQRIQDFTRRRFTAAGEREVVEVQPPSDFRALECFYLAQKLHLSEMDATPSTQGRILAAVLAESTQATLTPVDIGNLKALAGDSDFTAYRETKWVGNKQPLGYRFAKISSTTEFNTGLEFLAALYKEEADKYDHGHSSETTDAERKGRIHQQAELSYLQLLFYRDLLAERAGNTYVWKKFKESPVLQQAFTTLIGKDFNALLAEPMVSKPSRASQFFLYLPSLNLRTLP